MVGGAVAGALLGAAGSVASTDGRLAAASAFAVAAMVIALVTLRGGAGSPPQCDRETPRQWVELGPMRWAVRNGVALGVGAGSRLGFWLWYAVPVGAFLTGDPVVGAVLYGAYAGIRTTSAFAIAVAARRRGLQPVATDLVRLQPTAGAVAAGYLLTLGVAATVAIAL